MNGFQKGGDGAAHITSQLNNAKPSQSAEKVIDTIKASKTKSTTLVHDDITYTITYDDKSKKYSTTAEKKKTPTT